MLSGVAADDEVLALTKQFSGGELTRMLAVLQRTAAGFTRSASRRMDVELCLVDLCQPELTLDQEALNARLTKIEDQLRSGCITVSASPVQAVEEEERPPFPNDEDAPPAEGTPAVKETAAPDEAPVGFWTDIAAQVKAELRPHMAGFFATGPAAPVRGVLQGDRLLLTCTNAFAKDMINKPEVIRLVGRKASAKLGRQIAVIVTDGSGVIEKSEQMDKLLQFGKAHSDIINIKENV